MKRKEAAVLLAGALFALGGGNAMAATLEVDDNKVECKKAPFTSVQAAVTAASPGDSIKVCPGTYTEQVTVTKDDLKLFSRNPLAATLKAPPAMADPKAIVNVTGGATGVSVRDFVISGPGGGGCDSIRYGVLVGSSGGDVSEAEIRHNHITQIRDAGSSGCQNGNAVQVGRDFTGIVGEADVLDNTIDGYQKTGVAVDGAGSSARVRQNAITGLGAVNFIAQNGVQISRDAVGEVRHNSISDNLYAPQTFASAGVLLFRAGSATDVSHNTILRNDEGVYLDTQEGGAVTHNTSSDSTFDGFGAVNGTSLMTIEHNTASNNGFDGVYMGSDTADNTVAFNHLSDNVEHDCHDDSTGPNPPGVANVWNDNDGVTENKPGLCEGTQP